nr:amidase [Bradyrhizobium sp. 150]
MTSDRSVCDLTATALARALAKGELSSRDAVEAHLARIASLDSQLAAFVTVDAEGARRAADICDAAPTRVGPLHGVPIGIKDLTDTAGVATTYGSALFRDHIPAEDDLVVARLRRAGAIILGKTNTPEFGFGAVCTNKLCGPTRNPFDPVLTSGGSSGGSAVAVAAGMVPLAHGTDFGGSVRTPASFCDVASIRPTPGRIPAPHRPLGWDMLATHGFLARGVDDLELALSIFGEAMCTTHSRSVSSMRIGRLQCVPGSQRRPISGSRPSRAMSVHVSPRPARRSEPWPMWCRPRPIAAVRSRHFGRCAPRTSPTAMASC